MWCRKFSGENGLWKSRLRGGVLMMCECVVGVIV